MRFGILFVDDSNANKMFRLDGLNQQQHWKLTQKQRTFLLANTSLYIQFLNNFIVRLWK